MLKPKFTRVETGLPFPTEVRGDIPAGARVTVRLPAGVSMRDAERAAVRAEAVGPEVPREEGGFYWGFAVRAAESLAGVWTECEWESGYDVSVGMSERGVPLAEVARRTLGADGTGAVGGAGGEEEEEEEEAAEVVGKGEGEGGVRPVSEFRHMLAVFGGVAGLEAAVAADPQLVEKGVTNPAELFEHWVDVCPGQGSRTIRTEEAVWLGLMGLREVVVAKGVKR
jgi:predicted SPOUT superfamily RNA methylase MTH1